MRHIEGNFEQEEVLDWSDVPIQALKSVTLKVLLMRMMMSL